MDQQCVVAVYNSFEKACNAVQSLEEAAFPHGQVSLVTHSVDEEVPQPQTIQYGDRAEIGAAKGAGVGGLVGALLGVPLLAIPGVGPVLAAGPIATGLTGAVVGGLLGSMLGWGVHEDHVAQYEERIHKGDLLVVVNGDPQEVALAQEILEETEAESVELHAKNSADEASP